MSLLSLFEGKPLKVVIATPSTGVWIQEFGLSLCQMMTAMMTHRIEKASQQEVSVFASKGSMLPKMRMEAVQHAIDVKAQYILFLDSDHGFPRNLLHRLIHADKDVVAANCVTKTIPANTTARKFDPKIKWGTPVISVGKTGLEKVWRVGTGVMLVHMGVFRNIGAGVFDMFWRQDVQTYQGEDWSMCEAMEKAGYDIWVDHDLSLEVTHVGFQVFDHAWTHEGIIGGLNGVEKAVG